jgi:hypothetical protein
MTEPSPEEVAPPKRRGCRFGLAELCAAVFVIGLLVSLGVPVLMKIQSKAHRSKCASSIRQLGLAAVTYADDQRGPFPHLGPPGTLDGGGSTSPRGSDVAPRVIRAFFWKGYLDMWPEIAVCPGSSDEIDPSLANVRPLDNATFGWGGTTTNGASPMLQAAAKDRDLGALTDLSYGYTIRALGLNTKGSTPVVADRALSNHREGYHVVMADAHVEWFARGTPEAKRLSGTAEGDGFLTVWGEAEPTR